MTAEESWKYYYQTAMKDQAGVGEMFYDAKDVCTIGGIAMNPLVVMSMDYYVVDLCMVSFVYFAGNKQT
jgi:hypothetical protein